MSDNEEDFEYKQVILVRMDLKMPKGKLAAQVGHAVLEAALKADKAILQKWRHEGAKKVTLKIASQKELYKYAQAAKDDGIPTAIITDAGKTFFSGPTVTVCGIGPAKVDEIDIITGDLKML